MGTTAVYMDIELFRSTDNTFVFTKKTAPLDITGWTLRFRIKKRHSDTSALVGPITAQLTTPLSGICTVVVPEADVAVAGLTAGKDPTNPTEYWYDLQREDAGAKNVVAYGKVFVLPQTRVP